MAKEDTGQGPRGETKEHGKAKRPAKAEPPLTWDELSRRHLSFGLLTSGLGMAGTLGGGSAALGAKFAPMMASEKPTPISAESGSESLSAFRRMALFGEIDERSAPKVEFLEHAADRDKRTSDCLLETQDSVKILTIHGGTWLNKAGIDGPFRRMLTRIGGSCDILMTDPGGAALHALKVSELRGLERLDARMQLTTKVFRDAVAEYRQLAEQYPGRLNLNFYCHYPWIRFSLYDRSRAILTITPFLANGVRTRLMYTEDKWLIEALGLIFNSFCVGVRASLSDADFDKADQISG